MSGPLSSRFRVTATSCSAHRLCALCVAPFPASGRLPTLAPRPRTGPPAISLSFPSSFGDTTARTPASSSGPPSTLLYFPLRRSRRKHAMFLTLSPQHAPSMYPIPAASTSGVLLPTVRLYKIPLVLALLLHPHSSCFHSRTMKSRRRCEARFVYLR